MHCLWLLLCADSPLGFPQAKIWSTPALGDALRPWGHKTLLTLDQDPTAIDSPDFDLTLATLSTILASPPADPTPPSPGSILTSTTADGEGGDPTPPSPAMMLEYEALWLLLSTLSGSPPSPLPSSSAPSPASSAAPQALTWFLRAPSTLLPSSLVAPLSPSSIPTGPPRPVPHVPFAALKTVLARYAGEKGWDESQATTAIYSLVSKKVVMIERRGVGGAGVRFL